MSDTFVLYGVKFSNEDWVPLLGNLLVIIGISLTLYIALFVGNEEAVEASAAASPTKASTEAASTPKKSTKSKILKSLVFAF